MARLQATSTAKAAERSGKKVSSTTAAALRPREMLNAALGIERAAVPSSASSPHNAVRSDRQRPSSRTRAGAAAQHDVDAAPRSERNERSSSSAVRRRAAAPLEHLSHSQTGRKRGPLSQSWPTDEESQGSDSRASERSDVQARREPDGAAREETERELLKNMQDSVDAFNAIKQQSNLDSVYAEMKLLTEGLAVLAPGMGDTGAAVEIALRDSTRVAQDTAHDVLAQIEKALAHIEELSEKRRELYQERAKGRADWTARAAKLQKLNTDKVADLERDFHKRQVELRKELTDNSTQRGGEQQLRAAIEAVLTAI